ncbi:MAG: LysM peptidoglycan-binding domain-containing protein [Deltaproteobacteria bacterium]|nr:LysM peptidoglycan-binding domain-containing protein [Deltaproteobacteria bacterium]
MNIIIIAALFLSFAVGVNWMVSDKEKSDIKKELVQTQVVKKDMERGILDAKGRLGQKTKELEELEAKYKAAVEEKKRLEESLLKAEEARLIAEKKAESDIAALKQQESEKEGVQDKSSELEARLLAMEEARGKFEAEAKANAEKEARKRAEEGWLQAEAARAKAEETLAKKEEAESKLKTEEEMRRRLEADLKAKIAEITRLENEIATTKEAKANVEKEAIAVKEDMELKLQREEELRKKVENELKEKTDVIAGLEAGGAAATGTTETAVAQKGSGQEQGIEEDYRGEITELKGQLVALQEAKEKFEAETKTAVEARKRAEEALANKTEVESLLKREYLRTQLETDLKIRTTEIAMLEKGIIDLKGDINQKTKQFEELEARYRAEVDERKKTAELLAMAEEARRTAEKRLESEREVLKSAAKEGAEIDKLKVRVLEIESANKKIEIEAGRSAEEALANKTELESLLKRGEELRQKAEADLKTKIDEIERLEKEAEAAKKIAAKGSESAAAKAEESIADKTAETWQDLPKSKQGAMAVELKAGENWQEDVVIKYTVEKGDSLWKIAGREFIYNAPKLWVVIYKYNRDKLQNPNLLYPGQVLLIPKMVNSEDAKDSLLKAKSALEDAL